MEITEEQKDAFLRDLEEVFTKHRITIMGCHCCGSPFLMRIEDEELPIQLTVSEAGRYSGINWDELTTNIASGKTKY